MCTRKTPIKKSGKAEGRGEKSAVKGLVARTKPTISLISIKLALAVELRLEGYTRIEFDRVVVENGLRVPVHVLAEDEIGNRLAIYCIHNPEGLRPEEVLEAVATIQRQIGQDGEVVIAIPISLLDVAGDIFGLAPRIFAVDNELRVWSHACVGGVTTLIKHSLPLSMPDESDEDALEPDVRTAGRNIQYIT
ncbi:MAG: hypothetical protein ACUVQY_09405 [Thermoproteota archaeon]